MLNVYLGSTPTDVMKANDAWFDLHLKDINFEDPRIKDALLDIDGASVVPELKYSVETRFFKHSSVSMTELSTGCKTIINIISFPDKIFTVTECGKNALRHIFRLDTGNIHMVYSVILPKEINEVTLTIDGKTEQVKDRAVLSDKIFRYFESEDAQKCY